MNSATDRYIRYPDNDDSGVNFLVKNTWFLAQSYHHIDMEGHDS